MDERKSAWTARQLVRRALKAALATRDADLGTPYASMVLLATDIQGAPITLVSQLARHTRNLQARPEASVLVDLSNAAGDATSGGRISLIGQFQPDASAIMRDRFLRRHPDAAGYADFADFGFWRLEIDSAHMIEGFGRIVTLPGAALRSTIAEPDVFSAAEPKAIAQLRQNWPAVCSVDSEGVDLRVDQLIERLPFDQPAGDVVLACQFASNCLAGYREGPASSKKQ